MNKLRNNHGMSIGETLVAVLILLLVSAGLASGVSLASRYYTKTVRTSEANELYSTLESLISNELRYTNCAEFDGSGNLVNFFSKTFPIHDDYTNIAIVDGDKNLSNNYDYVAIGNNDNYNLILSKASYPNELGAKINSIKYDNGCFVVDLDIGTDEIGSLVTKAFSVRCLNYDGDEVCRKD